MWEIIEQAQALRSARTPFALATVVRRERPASAHPGDQAIVTPDGRLQGWIGGSCAEPVVIKESLRALREGSACLLRLGPPDARIEVTAEGIRVHPMTCHSGGTLEIFVDPCVPVPQALLVGHGPVVEALATLAPVAGFEVVVCSQGADAARFPLAAHVLPALEPGRIRPDAQSYVVVATHGEADEEALGAALRSEAPYVALVASQRRAAACKENLRASGMPASALERLQAPAGLDLGGVTAGEIAISIIAEMVQRRRAMPAGMPSRAAAEETSQPADVPAQAIDPVCGMAVEANEGTPSTMFQGVSYYFCCAGCLKRFQRDPQRYLAQTAEPSAV
jgi:xanthine dehydrogenase accessory factor